MKKKYFFILLGCLAAGALILSSFSWFKNQRRDKESSSGYVFKEQKTPVELKNTAWEFVQFTQGKEVKNLVGTDWVLQFEKDFGFTRICDIHQFAYKIEDNILKTKSSEVSKSLCQDGTDTIEKLFFSVLANQPEVKVTLSSGKVEKVLTITHRDTKFSFVPRSQIPVPAILLGPGAVIPQATVQVSATVGPTCGVQTEGQDTCGPKPFGGSFNLKEISGTSGVTDIQFTTNQAGLATFPVGFGTYQITYINPDKSTYPKLAPVIFSTTEEKTYNIELNLASGIR